MIEFLNKLFREKPKSGYIPSLNDIEMEVGNLSANSELQARLVQLAGFLPTTGFEIVRLKEFGGNISFKMEGRDEPVLKISHSESSPSLIASSRSKHLLTYWSVPYSGIGGREGLGQAIERLVFGQTMEKQYRLDGKKKL